MTGGEKFRHGSENSNLGTNERPPSPGRGRRGGGESTLFFYFPPRTAQRKSTEKSSCLPGPDGFLFFFLIVNTRYPGSARLSAHRSRLSPDTTMDQVIENLWLGNLASTADVESLKENNIHSILSVMRGRVVVQAVRVSRKDA